MHITFIRPDYGVAVRTAALEPVVFAILKGLTPPDCETVLVDDRLEDIPFDTATDLVALSVQTFTAKRAYAIADEYRRRGVPVVMGGYHPSFLPDEARAHADAVAIGDAEGVWPQIVADARGKALKPIYRSPPKVPLQGVRYDRSVFKGKKYGPLALAEFGRGCRFSCEFCSSSAFYSEGPFRRPVQDLLQELEQLEKKYLLFVDDNLFGNRQDCMELLRGLARLDLRWGAQLSVDSALDDELLEAMAKAGCMSVLVGVESLDLTNLTQMKKDWALKLRNAGGYRQLLGRIRAHGLMIYGSFVFGYDEDTSESFTRALDFALESKFFMANFNPLTPMPGAPIYERLKREGRLLKDPWWLHPDFRYGEAPFVPKNMTPEELTERCFDVKTRFNRASSILSRALDFEANTRSFDNFLVYLGWNLANKREIAKKQGAPLGGLHKAELFPARA